MLGIKNAGRAACGMFAKQDYCLPNFSGIVGSMESGLDWERLGHYVRDARGARAQKDITENGGPSDETLSKIERGRWKPTRSVTDTLAKLDSGLGWQPGSSDRVLRGGEPTPLPSIEGNVQVNTGHLPQHGVRTMEESWTAADARESNAGAEIPLGDAPEVSSFLGTRRQVAQELIARAADLTDALELRSADAWTAVYNVAVQLVQSASKLVMQDMILEPISTGPDDFAARQRLRDNLSTATAVSEALERLAQLRLSPSDSWLSAAAANLLSAVENAPPDWTLTDPPSPNVYGLAAREEDDPKQDDPSE